LIDIANINKNTLIKEIPKLNPDYTQIKPKLNPNLYKYGYQLYCLNWTSLNLLGFTVY
jgi:hypothetical protein